MHLTHLRMDHKGRLGLVQVHMVQAMESNHHRNCCSCKSFPMSIREYPKHLCTRHTSQCHFHHIFASFVPENHQIIRIRHTCNTLADSRGHNASCIDPMWCCNRIDQSS